MKCVPVYDNVHGKCILFDLINDKRLFLLLNGKQYAIPK